MACSEDYRLVGFAHRLHWSRLFVCRSVDGAGGELARCLGISPASMQRRLFHRIFHLGRSYGEASNPEKYARLLEHDIGGFYHPRIYSRLLTWKR